MEFLKLIRINHWVKNLFIILPLFFSGEFSDKHKMYQTVIAIIAFSLVASFVYILNDIFDVEFDKIHPDKKYRPIASGNISIYHSLFVGIFLLICGLVILLNISLIAFLFTIFYVILNLLYSFKLKHIAIIEFVIVAIGFVIRVLIGGEVSKVELTKWMIVLVFLLSLFIAVSKRRDDVYEYEISKKINRKVVLKYTVLYMDKLITIISSTLLMAYLLFISSESVISRYPSKYLAFSFLFVVIGVFRYNQITYVENRSGSPIKILYKDIFLQIILLLWGLNFFIIIYCKGI